MIKYTAFLFSFAVYRWAEGLRTWDQMAYTQGVFHRQPLNLDIVRSVLSGPKPGFALIEHQSPFENPRRVYWRGQNREIAEYTPTQAETPGKLERRPVEFFDYAAFTWQSFFEKWEHECYVMRTEDDQLIRDIVRSLASRKPSLTEQDPRRFVCIEKQTGPRPLSPYSSWAPKQSSLPEYEFWVGSSLMEPRQYQPKPNGRQRRAQTQT